MWVQVIPALRMPTHLPWLDYLVPAELEPQITIGQLVKIPLRGKANFAIVYKIFISEPDKPLKTVVEIIHSEPSLLAPQIDFLNHVAHLYQVSFGFLIKTSLFPLQKRKIKHFQTLSLPTPEEVSTNFSPYTYEITDETELKQYLEEKLSDTGQNLIIVPEIANIKTIIALLPEKYTDQVVTVHSDIKAAELFKSWTNVRTNTKKIIIGTRSAFFMPFCNLRNIFLLFESSDEHKNADMAPRFHSRDAALLLSHYFRSQLHLVTSSLSVESYFWQHKKLFEQVKVQSAPKPFQYEVVDMNAERKLGNTLFSQSVLDVLKNSSGHTFLFVYQRGSGKNTLCQDCGYLFRCPVCSLPITWYKIRNTLLCHHCGYEQPMIENCIQCSSIHLKTYGLGSENVAAEIQKMFFRGERNIVILDSLSKKSDFTPGTIPCISIGTKAAWAKLDWLTVSTTVFIDADTPLFIPEYQATERIWHQIHDARYRMNPNSELIVQTAHPNHSIFQHFFKPQLFYQTELKQRSLLRYPPYSFLIKIFAKFLSYEAANTESQKIYNELIRLTQSEKNITITPTQEKKNRTGVWKIITLKIAHNTALPPLITFLSFLPSNWKVDPHPSTLLRI